MEYWGKGNPSASAGGVSLPPSPHPFPSALFSGRSGSAATRRPALSQPSPGRADKKRRAYPSNRNGPPIVGGPFWVLAKDGKEQTAAAKQLSPPPKKTVTPRRGTADTRKATAAPRRFICLISAFWGWRGESEGGGNTFYAQAKRGFLPPQATHHPTPRHTNKRKNKKKALRAWSSEGLLSNLWQRPTFPHDVMQYHRRWRA